jgi:hypothetical protein
VLQEFGGGGVQDVRLVINRRIDVLLVELLNGSTPQPRSQGQYLKAFSLPVRECA